MGRNGKRGVDRGSRGWHGNIEACGVLTEGREGLSAAGPQPNLAGSPVSATPFTPGHRRAEGGASRRAALPGIGGESLRRENFRSLRRSWRVLGEFWFELGEVAG
jgi:hypothetical protein